MPSRCTSICCARKAWAGCGCTPDPRQAPAIRFNYLQSARDRADFRVSLGLLRDVLGQKALDRYRGEELFPGPDLPSPEQIDAWLRRAVETCYHPTGTCKMGGASDAMSVVDDELRVHALRGLRVVDASVMPSIVSGNTNAPTVMIRGEGGRPDSPPAAPAAGRGAGLDQPEPGDVADMTQSSGDAPWLS